jgi:hypothetical protein
MSTTTVRDVVTVNSLDEIHAALDALGAPVDGRVRVFRGQTREFKTAQDESSLLPALSRRAGSPMYDPAWLGAMTMFAARDVVPDMVPDLETSLVWGPALVQHYGPGSHFLDVTHDIDVALWFAVHRYHEHWIMLKGGDDAAEPQDILCSVAWSTEISALEAHAVEGGPIIYVFDVEPWDGVGGPSHGQLVDLLALAPSRQLADKAARIRLQSAALIYSRPGRPEGANLHDAVSLRMICGPDFDPSQAAARRWVQDIYPPPADDPLYKALVEFPSLMRFDPPCLQQPLPVPFQLTRPLPLDESPNVKDLGGDGSYASPKRMRFRLKPGPDLHVVLQLQEYLSLGQHMKPPLFHPSLMAGDLGHVELASRTFTVDQALPLILEAPLWSFAHGVDSARHLAGWIQSALPLGIADTIAGRATDNVYVEISPLDVVRLNQRASTDLMRALWVVRVGFDYAVTIFRTGEAETYSLTVRYRYNPEAGLFERQEIPELEGDLEAIVRSTLKALFITLTLLRDLSPGFKPPPSYSVISGDLFIPAPLLEPQLATPHQVQSAPYVIPKALDGTRYLRASGGPRETRSIPDDPAEALHELERYFPQVKALHYRAVAGVTLAALNASAGHLDRAREVAEAALEAARSTGATELVKEVEKDTRRFLQA